MSTSVQKTIAKARLEDARNGLWVLISIYAFITILSLIMYGKEVLTNNRFILNVAVGAVLLLIQLIYKWKFSILNILIFFIFTASIINEMLIYGLPADVIDF